MHLGLALRNKVFSKLHFYPKVVEPSMYKWFPISWVAGQNFFDKVDYTKK